MKTEGEQPAQPVDKPEVFKSIEDLRPYLLSHPDKDMVRSSCLHYLGDKFQAFDVSPSPERGKSDGWISVNDRLPEPSNPLDEKGKPTGKLNKVQIYAPSTVGVDSAHYWGTSIDGPMKGWSIMGVIAWRELPKPPKQ